MKLEVKPYESKGIEHLLPVSHILLCQREGRLPSHGRAVASSPSLQMDCLMICFTIFPGIGVLLTGLQFPRFSNLLNVAAIFAFIQYLETSFVFQKFPEIVADGPQPI